MLARMNSFRRVSRWVAGSTVTLFLTLIMAALVGGSGVGSVHSSSQSGIAMIPVAAVARAEPQAAAATDSPANSGEQIQVQIGATSSDSASGSSSSSGGVEAATTSPQPGRGSGGLAFTGVAVLSTCVVALSLLVAGLVLVRIGRRRRPVQ